MQVELEDQLHELARLFMSQFPLKPHSLDEFLMEYHDQITVEQRKLGFYILEMFNQI